MSQPTAGAPQPANRAPQPTPLELLDRFLPFVAVGGMIVTFLVMPQPFAIGLIGLLWLIATRLTPNRKFLGLTLTEALAWSATIVIGFLALALVLYSLGVSA
jgi:hypothetical protein